MIPPRLAPSILLCTIATLIVTVYIHEDNKRYARLVPIKDGLVYDKQLRAFYECEESIEGINWQKANACHKVTATAEKTLKRPKGATWVIF